MSWLRESLSENIAIPRVTGPEIISEAIAPIFGMKFIAKLRVDMTKRAAIATGHRPLSDAFASSIKTEFSFFMISFLGYE